MDNWPVNPDCIGGVNVLRECDIYPIDLIVIAQYRLGNVSRLLTNANIESYEALAKLYKGEK